MPHLLSPAAYRFLRKELDDLLWTKWDPIGVNDMAEALGEYDAYAATISDMLIDGEDVKRIADYLIWAASVNMGLSEASADHAGQIAAMAIAILAEAQRLSSED